MNCQTKVEILKRQLDEMLANNRNKLDNAKSQVLRHYRLYEERKHRNEPNMDDLYLHQFDCNSALAFVQSFAKNVNREDKIDV